MLSKNVFIGTSGYSYKDWIGPFYPVGLPQKEMLPFYAKHFSFTEINSTYYRLTSPKTFVEMLKKVPDDFVFAVKAYQSLTHKRSETVTEDASTFRKSLEPLASEGRLAAVLLQFPYSFHNTRENQAYLARLKDLLNDVSLVVEFRHRSWVGDPVWDLLNSLEMGFACVDAPRLSGLMKPVVKCTSSIGYIRFHGRNAGKWWQHEEAYERYNYLYSEQELKEWLPGISVLAKHAKKLFIAFNNHYQAQAVKNAKMLRDLLNRHEAARD